MCWPRPSGEYDDGLVQAVGAARSRLHVIRPVLLTLKETVACVAVVVPAGADVITTTSRFDDQRRMLAMPRRGIPEREWWVAGR